MNVRFEINAISDAYAMVCTNLTDHAAIELLNVKHRNQRGLWRVAPDPLPFPDVENGIPCPDGLLGCRHVLFTSDDGDRWRAARRSGISIPPDSYPDGQ